LACGDPVDGGTGGTGGTGAVTALVLRHLEPLSVADLQRLKDFAGRYPQGPARGRHVVQWWLQPKGPDTAHRLDADGPQLAYTLPDFGVTMPFTPTDFTQVNPEINRVLVSRALKLLDVRPHEKVIDWFCGLGNFTLPLATRAKSVLGIEGSSALLARAAQNFEQNVAYPLVHRSFCAIKLVAMNLFELTPAQLAAFGSADKWLVDPPREGAFALAKALVELHESPSAAGEWSSPERIVYVSCNPATLARDAELLVHHAGYRCAAAGVVNMFPHTAHVESMAVFERVATPA
ncbi:MAG: rRNA adenine N-6-methyltransferase family protein, partial [Burkholderiales bacterium]